VGVVSFGVITLSNVTFKLGGGGKGGKGTGGSSATNGGTGGAGAGTPPGFSGSGAGGHSVGIAYKMDGPPVINSKGAGTVLGAFGPGVAAFTSADGLRTVTKSADGVAAESLAF
jgi:hypothetical protein